MYIAIDKTVVDCCKALLRIEHFFLKVTFNLYMYIIYINVAIL